MNELLNYDPQSGVLTWRTHPTRRGLIGRVVGSLHASGYVNVIIKGKSYRAHRIIWLLVYGHWPTGCIDHINGVKNDNRLVNLRDVSLAENLQNQRRAHSNNHHGVLGVSLRPNGKWQALITTNGFRESLGCFANINAAGAAYAEAKKLKHVKQEAL